MTIYNPQLAELMNNIKNPPKAPTLKTFRDICDGMRTTHDFFILQKEKFEQIYSDTAKSGKFSSAGLKEMRNEFESNFTPIANDIREMFSKEIEKWKAEEQKNAYAVVNKAPTDEQARLLEVVFRRDKVTQAEIEMYAKNFGDNYACASAFRDFAKNKGFYVVYSDFESAEDRIEAIEKASDYLNDMLKGIDRPTTEEYKYMCFFGSDDNGNIYAGSRITAFSDILDKDTAFKPQKVEVSPITED